MHCHGASGHDHKDNHQWGAQRSHAQRPQGILGHSRNHNAGNDAPLSAARKHCPELPLREKRAGTAAKKSGATAYTEAQGSKNTRAHKRKGTGVQRQKVLRVRPKKSTRPQERKRTRLKEDHREAPRVHQGQIGGRGRGTRPFSVKDHLNHPQPTHRCPDDIGQSV